MDNFILQVLVPDYNMYNMDKKKKKICTYGGGGEQDHSRRLDAAEPITKCEVKAIGLKPVSFQPDELGKFLERVPHRNDETEGPVK